MLNDTRFKQQADSDYFEELLARIRDIRSSENVFYKKVLDLFATSADYQKNAPETHRIFAIVQNKLHWAAHGHTAAEIVHDRVDAAKSNMGLTSWSGQTVRKLDIEVSKNYLSAEEFDTLNRLVDANLDIAELQARARKVSYMRDWETKLGEVLTIAGHDILKDQGIMSRDQANLKATIEYEIFNRGRVNQDSQIEQDFEEASKLASKLRE